MSKELFVTSTPHETKVAIVEDDQLVEVYYERENEYTLAGSVYKGKVTRVLPGMQSAFVEIGLERDAFLYVTDFLEEVEEGEDSGEKPREARTDNDRGERGRDNGRDGGREGGRDRGGRGRDRGGRDRGGRGRNFEDRTPREAAPAPLSPSNGEAHVEADFSGEEPAAQFHGEDNEGSTQATGEGSERGPRRWRGRRGRRRRGGRGGSEQAQGANQSPTQSGAESAGEHNGAEHHQPAAAAEAGFTIESDFEYDESEENRPEHGHEAAHEGGHHHHSRSGHSPVIEEEEGDGFEEHEEEVLRESEELHGQESSSESAGESSEPRPSRPARDRSFEEERRAHHSRMAQGEPTTPPPTRGGSILLPGESLAKFGRKTEETDQPKANAPSAPAPTYKPSSLVQDVSGFAASGLLAGETLRKYKDRAPEATENKPRDQETRERDQQHERSGRNESRADQERAQQHPAEESVAREQAAAPPQSLTEQIDVAATAGDAAPATPSTERQGQRPARRESRWERMRRERREEREGRRRSQQPQQASGQEPDHDDEQPSQPESLSSAATAKAALNEEREFDRAAHESAGHESNPGQHDAAARGPHDFGSGTLEEEEVGDEEELEMHDGALQAEGEEFEELEEETLTDDIEGEVIRAGEGLAAAFADTRRGGDSEAFLEEDVSEEETEEGDESEIGEEDEAEELLAEGDFTEGGSEGESEQVDPEDPNYSGRAEIRGPSGRAAFQQRGNASREQRRGGRPDRGRGGRRPVRGGGKPRRHMGPRAPLPQINELLKEGQEILVQIAKEPIAKKGARITSHIALPGRFLVYMPTVNHTGVSRKIGSDEERMRLKRILLSEKGENHGGFIVRTAAAGASEDDLRADIRFLINLWNEMRQRSEASKAPALIYHDLNLVERILRDQVTANFSQIWTDSEQEYERILRFAQRFQPSLLKRVKLWTKEAPLFENFGLTEEINKALKSKVWLKSGGYIVINQTEALVAIDINTGKYVGKTARLEDTIVKTNIDAIKEIVRQIRLRDLGGIIVIDFIDMDERRNRQRVMQELEEALKADRSPSKVLQFNDFGLVAITRKRVKQSLERTLGTQCTYCVGTGFIKSVTTVCNEIYVELRKTVKHIEGRDITLRVNPEVAKQLKSNSGRWLVEMEELTGKSVIVKSDATLHQELFDIN